VFGPLVAPTRPFSGVRRGPVLDPNQSYQRRVRTVTSELEPTSVFATIVSVERFVKGNTWDPDPLGRHRFWDTFCGVGSLDMQLARRTWQAVDKIIIETEAAPYEPKVAHRHSCSRECVAK
jgi:hypothetical protein